MGRGRWHRSTCKVCGAAGHDGGKVSGSGLCVECAKERFAANLEAMMTGEGDYYDHWLRRSFMAAHRRLLDGRSSQLDAQPDQR